MLKSTLVRAAALLVLMGATLPFAVAKIAHRNGLTPVVFGMPPVLVGNEKVQIEIDLSDVTPVDQVVEISTSNSCNWSSLPSEVVVPAGQSKVYFYATTSSSPLGIIDGSASFNGGCAGALSILIAVGSI